MGLYDNTPGDKLRDRIAALFGFASEDDRNLLDVVLCGLGAGTPMIMKQAIAGAATVASTPAAETILGPIHDMKGISGATARQVRLLAVKVMQATAALTGSDTNYATIGVYSYTSAGATKTTVASYTTKITGGTGSWAAYANIDLSPGIVASAAALPAGGTLTYDIAKSATTGVSVAADAVLAVYGIPL